MTRHANALGRLWGATKTWRHVLLCFVASRLMLQLAGMATRGAFRDYMDLHYVWHFVANDWLDLWAAWDSGHYLSIIRQGYSYQGPAAGFDPALHGTVAFFPLYPLLVVGLKALLGHTVMAGVLLSNGCLLVAMRLLHAWTEKEHGRAAANHAVTFCAFFPYGHIFSAFYTESLFLALLLGVFLLARRGSWAWAGVLGMLLCATRLVGLFAAPALLLLWHEQRRAAGRSGWTLHREDLRVLWLGLMPLGLLGYMLHLHLRFGDALAFVHVQTAWGREASDPFSVLWNSLTAPDVVNVFNGVFVLAALGVLVAGLVRGRLVEGTLGLSLLLPSLLSGPAAVPLVSVPRYCVVVFPIYMFLGLWTARRPEAYALTLAGLSLWTGWLTLTWAAGHAIAM